MLTNHDRVFVPAQRAILRPYIGSMAQTVDSKETMEEVERVAKAWIGPMARAGYASKGFVYFLIAHHRQFHKEHKIKNPGF